MTSIDKFENVLEDLIKEHGRHQIILILTAYIDRYKEHQQVNRNQVELFETQKMINWVGTWKMRNGGIINLDKQTVAAYNEEGKCEGHPEFDLMERKRGAEAQF